MARSRSRVVVVVEEDDAEADERQRRRADAASKRRIGEQTVAEIAEQVVRFELEIGDDEVQQPVAVVVAEVGAHAGPRLPSLATATPAGRPTSRNDRLRLGCDTGSCGVMSLATNRSGQPSSS